MPSELGQGLRLFYHSTWELTVLTYLIIYLLTYLLIYLLTEWSRVLLEQLTGLQLVRKFPTFYGIRRFINAFTSARHLSLSWARPIQSMPPHPTSWRSILILFSHLRLVLPSGLFPQLSSRNPFLHLFFSMRATYPAQFILLILSPEQNWVSSTDH